MPQGVNRDLWQIGPRDEIVEPTRDAIRVNWCAVILRENTVTVNPAIPHRNSLFPLPFAMRFQQFKRLLRQLDRANRGIRLRAFRENAFFRQVLRCPANRDHVVLEVDILPFKTAKFSAPYTAEQEESNHHLILVRFVI